MLPFSTIVCALLIIGVVASQQIPTLENDLLDEGEIKTAEESLGPKYIRNVVCNEF